MSCFERKERINENFDIDYQLNLPQYLDDVERLVKCCVKNVASDYELTQTGITVYGKSVITVMYKASDGITLSSIFEEEFSRAFDLSECDYPSFAEVNLYTAYSNSRLVNQRRIDVHTALNAQISVYCKRDVSTLNKCEKAFLKTDESETLNIKGCGACSFDFDESFSISSSDTQIKNIVNTYVNCTVSDKKIIKDKMLVKINSEISCVYCDEKNKLGKAVYSFSSSKIIEISDCLETDNALVSAQISQLYIKPKANADNRLCDIETVGRIVIQYKICSSQKQSLAVDTYVPHYSFTDEKSKLSVKSNPIYYYDTKNTELSFECEKSIVEIIDLNVQILRSYINMSVLNVQILLRFFYYDDTSSLCYFEKDGTCEIKLNDNEYEGEGTATLNSFDFVIGDASKIKLRLSLDYTAYLYTEKTVEYITDINVQERLQNENAYELTLYFASDNESVWEIAKRFSTDTRLIMSENDLSSDKIKGKRVLLVPGM